MKLLKYKNQKTLVFDNHIIGYFLSYMRIKLLPIEGLLQRWHKMYECRK